MFQETTALKKIARLNKRIRIVQGGTSASKTVSVLIYLIGLAQADKTPTVTSIVSETMPHLKKGAMRDFLNILQAHGYYNDDNWNATDSTYTFETGSKIEFFGVDDASKVRGPRRDRLFINEANNVGFETFDQLEVRTNQFIIIDFNPTAEFWALTDVCGCSLSTCTGPHDADHIILTYLDNEALPAAIVQSIESKRPRKSWWRVYGQGLLGEVEGRIYTGWQIIDEIPHEARLERYGLDFGYTNDPTAIIALYYLNGGYIVDEVCYQKGLLNKNIADIILNQERKAIVIADSAEPKSIDEIGLHSISIIPTQKGQDSVRNGIAAVQSQRISVTKRSVNLLSEYRKYLWAVDKDGKLISPNEPEEGNDHALDAVRYAISSLTEIMPESARNKMAFQFDRNHARMALNSAK